WAPPRPSTCPTCPAWRTAWSPVPRKRRGWRPRTSTRPTCAWPGGASPSATATGAGCCRSRTATTCRRPSWASTVPPAGRRTRRALGPAAQGDPDVAVPARPPDPTAADVVRRAIAAGVQLLLRHDALVRLGGDPEHVHQARVGTRRLRSHLRTFRPLLDRAWV